MFGVLRYILASLVVVAHLGPLEYKYTGYYAVLCFFTLSGYILSAAYKPYSTGVSGYRRFYMNRLLRIFPAYLAALMVTILIVSFFPVEAIAIHPRAQMPATLSEWIGNFMIINRGTFTGFLLPALLIPASWSLGIELIYWLAIPLMLKRHKLLKAWLFISAALLAAFYIQHMPIEMRYFSLWGGGASFALGSCIYNFNLAQMIPSKSVFFIIAGAVLYYALSLFIFTDPFYWGLLGAVFVNALLVAACARLEKSQAESWPIHLDSLLGNLSYPIFLIHITMGIIIQAFSAAFEFRSLAFLCAGFALTNIAAYAIWRCVEMPVQKIRDNIRGASSF